MAERHLGAPPTFSAGIATIEGDALEATCTVADAALTAAKVAGRNRALIAA